MKDLLRWMIVAFSVSWSSFLPAAIAPYTPDANTLHLWHLDEGATPCLDSAAGGTNLTALANGASLSNPSFTGFGTALSTVDGGQAGGATASAIDAYLAPRALANNSANDNVTWSFADPTSGAFTFEAIVWIGFDPAANLGSTGIGGTGRNVPMQIISGDQDNSGGGVRSWQFRLDPIGVNPNADGYTSPLTQPALEFININNGTGIQNFVAPIPTNGSDAIVSNGWYHVAVSYDGNEGVAGNLLIYWTLVDTNRTVATQISSRQMTLSLNNSGAVDLCIGNTGRTTPNNNFIGLIDEVRISSVARPASGMLFFSTELGIVRQPAPTNQVIGIGQPLSYSVIASGLNPSYRWRHNGSPITNATNNTFSIAAVQPADSGNYDVVVTNTSGAVTSIVVSVTVTNLAILSQPVSLTANYASTVTFSVGAAGAQPIFYQWRKSGSSIGGATNSSLGLGPLAAADQAGYDVVLTNSLASVTSGVANLALTGPLVSLTPVTDGINVAASGYAYAGSSAINAVAFICSGLTTVSNRQFLAYYGRHQTDASDAFNNTIWIARRTLGSNVWEVFRTAFTANNITDGHDVVVFGIDGSNYLHMSWGMHDENLHYAISTAPVTGSQPITFGPDLHTMTGTETSVTYPQFLPLPNGDLFFLYRVGSSGSGNTWLNHWSPASQAWTNVNIISGTPSPFIQAVWPFANYNAYPNLPCLDAAGNFYLVWTWRETPAYESNHDLNFAKSLDGGVTWRRFDSTPYDLPICRGENGDSNSVAQLIVPIPQNYSLINQAGMCLDASNNPVIATWWAPGSGSGNYQRQYMIAFPDTNGVWLTRQLSNRTNDPPGTMMLDGVVRDLGRPVAVCDRQNRILVLYRDNFGSNGLTVAYSLPYALDPQRTNWTMLDLTTDNLGNYEPVIDLARWQRDNVLNVLYQPSAGEGYTPPANNASPIGVLEWNAAAWFAHRPTLQLSFVNATNASLAFNAQPGWEYRVQTSTNLTSWSTLATLAGVFGQLQFTHTNSLDSTQRYWRIETREGGF